MYMNKKDDLVLNRGSVSVYCFFKIAGEDWIFLIITFFAIIVAGIVRSSSGVLIVPFENKFGWDRSVIGKCDKKLFSMEETR
ncbi:hypothetical protein ACFWDG_26935 [Peribacillus sp. NPDC060186]